MANLADLMVRLGVDADDLTSGFESAVSAVEDNLGKIGVASAAAGAGLEGFARGQAPLRESGMQLAAATGESTDSIRDLALEASNVTFPLDEVYRSMEAGRQQGIKSGDQLQEFASFWDTVGDASGESGPVLAESAVALRAVGIEAGNDAEALDALGFITRETTSSNKEFLTFLERTGPELRDMGADVNDAAAIVGVLESEMGMSGRTARSEFRSAISESDGTLEGMLDTLGISTDQFDEYSQKVSDSSGVIQEQADIHAESYTAMQKAQHWLQELMHAHSGLFEVASALAMPLVALGPIIKGLFFATSLLRTGIVTVIPAIWGKVTALVTWGATMVAQGARAVGSLILTAAQFTIQFAIMAAQATINGIRIAAVWTAQIIASAARGAAAMAVNAARVVASWVLMGAQSLIQAARMAAAWVIAMGPIGWIITAIVGLVAIVIANWDTIKEWTINIWQTVSDWVSTKFDEIVQWVTDGVTSAANWVRDGFNDAKNWAINIWNSIVTYIKSIPGRILSGLAAIGNLASRFAGWINSARVAVVNRFMAIVSWVGGIPGRILSALGNLGSLLVGQGRAIIDGFLNGLKATWGKVTDFVGGIASWIADNKGPISYDRKLLIPAGHAIMDGLNEGLQDEMGELGTTLDDITWMLENGIDPDMGDISGPRVSGIESRAEFGGGSRGQGEPVQINVTVNESSNAAETGRLVVSKIRHQLKAQGVDIGEISFA